MLKISPVGSRWTKLKPVDGGWYDSNPYGTRYLLGGRYAIHTGADLNLPGNADRDMPVYAMQDGVVLMARRIPNSTWGNLIVIAHAPKLHTRYAHLQRLLVAHGQTVRAGTVIGTIGNSGMEHIPGNDHLHFDICASGLLGGQPLHWPGDNLALVHAHYVDPFRYLFSTTEISQVVVATGGPSLNIRAAPSLLATIVGQVRDGAKLNVYYADGWSQLADRPGAWVATRFLRPL